MKSVPFLVRGERESGPRSNIIATKCNTPYQKDIYFYFSRIMFFKDHAIIAISHSVRNK